MIGRCLWKFVNYVIFWQWQGKRISQGSREPAYCTAFSVKATDGTGEETGEKTSDPWKTEDHSDRGGGSFAQAGRRNPGTGGEDPAGNQLRYGRCHRRYLYGWRYAAIGSWGSCEASGTISGCEVSFLQWRCHRRVGAIEPWNTGFCSYAAAH